MMKKITAILLIMVLAAALLTGCGNEEDGPVMSFELTENGIVPAAEMEKAMKNGSVLYVKGKQGDYEFQWAVFGSKLTEAKDVDLGTAIERLNENEYLVKLQAGVDFSPSLSFRIPEAIGGESAQLYDSFGNSLGAASVSSYAKYTDVCFYVINGETTYDIVFEQRQEEIAVTADTEAPGSAETVSGQEAVMQSTEDWLSPVSQEELNVATGSAAKSDGSRIGQDQYHTDPVPEGKPLPVEPENQTVTGTSCTCTFSITCSTILNNMDLCDPEKVELVPADGWILQPVTVTFSEGESVFTVLQRLCRERGIHMEFEWTPMYNSAYIEGIHNLYEFDVGNLSGWMYKVNGWFPNYGCSRYVLQDGDTVVWCYTCDLGYDVGGGYAVGG